MSRSTSCRFVGYPLAGILAIGLSLPLTYAQSVADNETSREETDADAPATNTAIAADYVLEDWLDEQYTRIWKESEITPEFVDDATFLRRVSLDLIGRIPSVAAVQEFEADTSPDKWGKVVDKLLADTETSNRNSELYTEHFARLWRRVMLPPGTQGATMSPQFEPWLRQKFRENTPYDEIVEQLVSARGEDSRLPMVYYQAVGGTPESQATEIARVFLGVRIGCAQCHDHPFTSWKQQDFWGLAAFFNGTQVANLNPDGGNMFGLMDDNANGKIAHEGKSYDARFLWEEEPVALKEGERPRDVLAEWITSADNPAFAANAVNRVWQLYLGRGQVAEVDDLDLASAEDRQMLDELGQQFVASGYDLRWLVAGICKSRVYRLTTNVVEGEYPSLAEGTRPLKTLTPEQTFDSLEQALLLPVSRSSDEAARHNGQMTQIVQRLDESSGRSPEEYTAGVPQSLLLMNGPLMANATDLDRSRTLRAVVDAPFLSEQQKLETLFLAVLTRRPMEEEQAALLQHLSERPDEASRKAAYADIFWALLNSPEFVLCR